jgi:hypothetical protein
MRQKEAPKRHDKAKAKGKEWIWKVVVDSLDMARKNRECKVSKGDPKG